jgi:Icc-related predicted phosphoesterase
LHVDAQDRDFDLPKPPPEADLMVIAGDICDGFTHGYNWLERQRQRGFELPILWVPGNHDFYACINPHAALDAVIRDCFEIGVTVLARGEVVEIAGVRIVGATLWTDFEVAGSDPIDIATATVWARNAMPDYRSIDVGLRRLRPADTLAWHRDHRATIGRRLAKDFDGPTVVITHHAPHRLSLDDPNFPDPSDGSFASDLGVMMDRYRPDLWVHGHLHWRRDYVVGDTRVICNPRGYAREHGGFDSRFVVEVPT